MELKPYEVLDIVKFAEPLTDAIPMRPHTQSDVSRHTDIQSATLATGLM